MAAKPKSAITGGPALGWAASPITLAQAAKACGRTPEWARRLVADGHVVPSGKKGTAITVTVAGFMGGVISHYDAIAKEATKTASVSRVQDARAAEIEMRIAERKRDLIPQDEALLAISLLCGKVSEEFAGLPARVTRDISLRRTIEAETHGAQTRIAKALEKLSGYLGTGDEPPINLD